MSQLTHDTIPSVPPVTRGGGRGSTTERRAAAALAADCASVCSATADGCLDKGGVHASADHIRALLDCIELCRASAAFMSRGSPLHARVCAACAEACDRCAESCARVGPDDVEMQACVAICRRCAESCRRMAVA